jgi:MoaA/NifB/PqqE/SkfB family radical SAM enzyme
VIKPNNATFLRFAGGELFLYSQFSQLADFLSTIDGIDINFTTNGSYINDSLINNLKKIRPKLIKISLLSLREDVYKSIIGVDFPLSKTLENIGILAKIFEIGINMTIIRNTIQDVRPLIDFCLNNEISNLFFSQLTPSGRGLNISDQRLSTEEIKELSNIIKDIDRNKLNIRYDNDSHCSFNEDFVLNWNGDVFPCPALTSYPEFKIGTFETDISIMRGNIKKMTNNRTKKCFVEEFVR